MTSPKVIFLFSVFVGYAACGLIPFEVSLDRQNKKGMEEGNDHITLKPPPVKNNISKKENDIGKNLQDVNGPNKNLLVEHFGKESELHAGDIAEGDIVLTNLDVAFLTGKIQGDAVIGDNYKWSNVIPYITTGLSTDAENAIEEAIAEYHTKTCLKFQRRTDERDYIEFFADNGCYSYVGKQGGKQQVSLGSGCEYKSTAVHEILHALGFWHEQSRPDRDNYITIHYENIRNGMAHNFDKHNTNSYGKSYDYESVMHYRNDAFSMNGERTITPKSGDPNRRLGQPWNGGLSTIDAQQVNAHYECGGVVTTESPTATPNPGGCALPVQCVDKFQFCQTIADMGYCTLCWTKQNCANSCNGPDLNDNCSYWESKGYCTGIYEAYMSRNCKRSCNKSCNK